MRKRRLLLAATALTSVLGACERPVKVAKPKQPDAGVPNDAEVDDPEETYANTKGSLYDDGFHQVARKP